MIPENRRDYDEDRDIPRWLKWTFIAINRVGFPIVAFILIWYTQNVTAVKMVASIEQNTLVLMEVRDAISRFRDK